ncbi:MAG: permease [Candidatus Riflebacteria bacterium]|nr:permease [Candidatus Riflebacteria bacterium]
MLQYLTTSFIALFSPLEKTWIWPGLVEVGKFLGTHLISGMVPAFFIAGAIAIFLDKQQITKLMGAKANPLIAYPVAAFSGGLLTVCSCGVIPIFTGILQQGAGIGPAFTFLMASPAVNLIALSYTYTLLGTKFMVWRGLLVMASAISIGAGMKVLCGETEQPAETSSVIIVEEESERTGSQLLIFFMLLVLVMVTATGVLDPIIFTGAEKIGITSQLLPRLLTILAEILLLAAISLKWFEKQEIILWLRKSKSLFWLIFPKVVGGIFLCGLIAAAFPLSDFMKFFDSNDFSGNFVASILGSMMYFGTIVGVTIVSILTDYGMHPGPAMTLLLSAPAVSLPSILALVPIAGAKKSAVFLALVIVFSALSGYIFGMTF